MTNHFFIFVGVNRIRTMRTSTKALIIIAVIIIADQILKIWIKTNMMLGQEYQIFGDWFIIHFTENNGMAFGLEFWGKRGKIFLTLDRKSTRLNSSHYS